MSKAEAVVIVNGGWAAHGPFIARITHHGLAVLPMGESPCYPQSAIDQAIAETIERCAAVVELSTGGHLTTAEKYYCAEIIRALSKTQEQST